MMLMPARRASAATAPTSWLQLPHGEWMRAELSKALAPHCAKVFGYYFARVGQLAKSVELPDLRVQHQFSAALTGEANIRTDLEYWPFAEGVLDAIMMIGQLEFERDPHQVLRELSRSLIADGHIILAGFNPLSPAIMTGVWPANVKKLPWCGRYFSKARINDWLALLNFEIIDSGYVAPTMMFSKTASASVGLTHVSRFIPQVGAMYYIVARKREFPLTVIRHKQRAKPHVNAVPLANRIKSPDMEPK
ncbi:methyltransferase domain-containing protein [Pseudidiomarina marina]|uniref:Methyltransferase type 11 domain-containing protein n=1 Tax=Pseudidiomarina marina TaxID=502366 RepID=A0A432YIP1_9GAMM|nr:methyltransferase domain-containing protein [Pseudidiomarina marina]RUO60833.1 hypothetical protein CWI76_00705 [Pseudidiomarina marina]